MSPIIKRLSPQECKKWTAESDGIAVGLPSVEKEAEKEMWKEFEAGD